MHLDLALALPKGLLLNGSLFRTPFKGLLSTLNP